MYYGYEVIDTVIINRSSVTFRQLQEAENAVQGITDNKEKHRAIVAYVVTHPDSDGSVYLMRYLSGVINFRKCLSELTEHAKNGMMKRLYDYIAGGVAEQDKYQRLSLLAMRRKTFKPLISTAIHFHCHLCGANMC